MEYRVFEHLICKKLRSGRTTLFEALALKEGVSALNQCASAGDGLVRVRFRF